MSPAPPITRFGVLVRVGVFAFLEIAGLLVFARLMQPAGYLVAATMSTFAAAAIANSLALRIYERSRLAAIGLSWNAVSGRHLLLGFGGGAGAAIVILVLPLAAGAAELRPVPETPLQWGSIGFVTLVLLFGAVGEEMLFRGYGFQVLVGLLGPFAALLPVSVLFALAHTGNPDATTLALANTFGWGVLLGYSLLRGGDLWLPIGLHFGWNGVLPLFGVNVSGFTMKLTGYAMHWNIDHVWSGGAYGPEGGLLCSLALVILFVGLAKAPIEKQPATLLRPFGEA